MANDLAVATELAKLRDAVRGMAKDAAGINRSLLELVELAKAKAEWGRKRA